MAKFQILKHTIRTICMMAALLTAFLWSHSEASTRWETPRQERQDVRLVVREGDVEIKAAKGVIVVSSPKPVQIKVFTILGQLVSQETLPAGTSQLNISSHGVYIIKTAEITCKVAI